MNSRSGPPEDLDHPTSHLLKRVQAGDASSARAWAELLERCESRLRILAGFRLAPNVKATVDVDDLLQEVWIDAARRITEFEDRGPGSLQRWLAVILHHKLLHAGRKAQRLPFPEAAMGGTTAEQEGLFLGLSRTQPGVSLDLQRADMELKVKEALAELPEELREAVLLKVYEGITGREAAERLGLSETGFSKRFRTALDRIGQRLGAQ